MPAIPQNTSRELLPLDLCLAGAGNEETLAVKHFAHHSRLVRRLFCTSSAAETLSWLRGSRGPAVLLLDLVRGKPAEDFLEELGCLCAQMDLVLFFLTDPGSPDAFTVSGCRVGGAIVREDMHKTLEKMLELVSEYFASPLRS
ncbi:MAG: hypothetical protein HS115_07385 [Spirochaetales bacterium]|nr:hypothetical protein [Spirochaetales bacterium]